jgi:hypothetical protein
MHILLHLPYSFPLTEILKVNYVIMMCLYLFIGVYKDIGPWMYEILIDLHAIEELYTLQVSENCTCSRRTVYTSCK